LRLTRIIIHHPASQSDPGTWQRYKISQPERRSPHCTPTCQPTLPRLTGSNAGPDRITCDGPYRSRIGLSVCSFLFPPITQAQLAASSCPAPLSQHAAPVNNWPSNLLTIHSFFLVPSPYLPYATGRVPLCVPEAPSHLSQFCCSQQLQAQFAFISPIEGHARAASGSPITAPRPLHRLT